MPLAVSVLTLLAAPVWARPLEAGAPASAPHRGAAGAPASAPHRGATGQAALAVIPFPGTPDASPESQIIFSLLGRSAIRRVTVSGTSSGPHPGRLTVLPGGAGTAFLPTRPFTPGEQVTVEAALSSARAGSASGDHGRTRLEFSFGVARGASVPASPGARASSSRVPAAGWQSYRSEPRLHPPLVRLDRHDDNRSGDIFLSPVNAPQMGPLILSPSGQLVWFKHTGRPTPFNFEVQRYLGHPVLTWWQGNVVGGHGGAGRDEIMDSSYRVVKVLHGGYGYSSDLHEFQLIPHGRALIDAYVPVHADLSSVGGSSNGTVLDCVIQELDVRTGRVLWEWHALGHVPLSASYNAPTSSFPFDYFHLNSIQQLAGGKLIVSARNTWAVYMVDERTGRVVWTLGGKYSNYRMGPGTNFEWQHDARMHRRGILTVFDDAGFPQEETESSAKELEVNARTGVVSLVRRFTHSPPLLAGSQGNVQLLGAGKVMVGWGSVSEFSEFGPSGRELLDGHFRLGTSSYRAYRFAWTGHPLYPPSLAVEPGPDGTTRLFASWNGATQVATWEVLVGQRRSDLIPLSAQDSRGFQTTLALRDQPRFFAVDALDAHGNVLNRSKVIGTPAHISIFGGWVFGSVSTGLTRIPVNCYSPRPCQLGLTLRRKRSILASASSTIPARSTSLVPLNLPRAAARALAGARHEQLAVQVSAGEHSGLEATRDMMLVGYSTSGSSPSQSVAQSPSLRFLGTSEFVGQQGDGGILASCLGAVPCQVQATIAVGSTVIADPGIQSLGADETGLVAFRLTPTGQAMLQSAPGNQLSARVTMTNGNSVASGQVVLIRYG